MTSIYFDVDSTHRNRNIYPKPSEFIIKSGRFIQNNEFDDFYLDGFPYVQFKGNVVSLVGIFAGGNSSSPVINGSNVNNFYVGAILKDTTTGETSIIKSYNSNTGVLDLTFPFNSQTWNVSDSFEIIDKSDEQHIFLNNGPQFQNAYSMFYLYNETINEYSIIKQYNPTTKIFTLQSPFSGAWNITDTYDIVKSPPVFNGQVVNVISSTLLELDGTASNINDYYKGMYIRIIDSVYLITKYIGSTRMIYIGTPFTLLLPTPFKCSILHNAVNNEGGILPFKNSKDYNYIELVDLILPNTRLNNTFGGNVAFYPYVYVQMSNNTNNQRMRVYDSNNNNSNIITFRIPIVNINSPETSPFVRMLCSNIVQSIKINLCEDVVFKVLLPNGELLNPVDEVFSPKRPNPLSQIHATFKLT
jgi:hypothetical protein